ncbi:hypothetical protein Aph01nite_64650 [Acrocarpospora phusangensis]|uniref:DUF2199 domain-containing protein n=1 Tax=Acrocarpospora phusangensis TaxID=1070424 RepID=A0A919QIQ4_9ACTN|nr:DUF2199 domain-containing protein [Acrocarpospora phusangensis]GIH28155.1 hypothetical protein Aph01nite_64650 [Acrocarpospora phusangensis]
MSLEGRSIVGDVCAECGESRDRHDRQVRFRLPDPVLGLDEAEREALTWSTDDMMQVQGYGAFIRCLLPVSLTGGYRVTFAVWLSVHPDVLQKAYATWWEPEYATLELPGVLANAIPPWGDQVMAAPAEAVVQDQGQLPYITGSRHAVLWDVLCREWPHTDVLSGLP